MKIIFKLGYTEEDQLPRKSQYRTKQMIQLLEYLKSIPGEHLDKRCYRELSGGQQQRVLFPISVCMVCIDRRNTCYWYLLMNIFSTGPNLSGDVCSTLFGSTSILTLTHEEVLLCAVLSITVVILFILLYLAKNI